MKIQIVFDSDGNTKQLAWAVSSKLAEGADVKTVAVDQTSWQSLAGVDLLVIGSPTQRWRPTKAVQAFLEEIPYGALNGLAMTAFDTRLQMPRLLTGSAARSIAKRLKKKGGTVLLPPESFFVNGREGPLLEGEAERASSWALEILKKYIILHPLSKNQRH